MNVTGLRAEYTPDALGLGTTIPRLSWQITDAPTGWAQASATIEITDATGTPATFTAEGPDQVLVAWPGIPLASRERRTIRVRTTGADGSASDWSEPLAVEAGLLDSSDWTARLVHPAPDAAGPTPHPAMLLRREITLRETPVSARLYLTAQGLFEAELNGRRLGDVELAPGWTSYHHRLQYLTFDVTDQLTAGPNVLGAWLADGWYRGYVGFDGGVRNLYGDRTGLLAQLEVTYADGSAQTVSTDESWRSTPSPITATGLYEGETYDARALPAGWSGPGFDDTRWGGVTLGELDTATLVAPLGPPVRCTDELPVLEVITTPSGRTILDFGQNASGRLRIRVTGRAGDVVTVRHAEVLENGELGVRPLRRAAATDRYVLTGDSEEVWEPRFTIHGFRYAEIDGWPEEAGPLAESITYRVLHSDLERTGWWSSSDELLNRLHENVLWGLRSNFVSIPTDCPQRDERLGWTGDIGVFAPTASYLYDTAGFLGGWLHDLAAEQADFGGMTPIYVPYLTLGFPNMPLAAWGDAATLVPWAVYQRCGDHEVLARQFDSMTSWVDLVAQRAGESLIWDGDVQLGDWLDPTAPPDNPAEARTAPELVATAYFALSARITGRAAEVLGRTELARHYTELSERVAEAFRHEFTTPHGRLASDSQTAYAVALEFDLLTEPEARRRAADHLAEIVVANNHRVGTGFVGTPLICDALANNGHLDTAYHLLTNDACPSWLYTVSMGATTMWERWDSMLPDGSINPGDMTSFNHYALGAVADFLHRVLGGLEPVAPGYRRVRIAPRPGAGLTCASATHRSPYGEVAVSWRREGEQLTLDVTVPVGVTAVIDLPELATEVGHGQHSFTTHYRAPEADPPRPPAMSLFERAMAAAREATGATLA
ncbi:glycoside hydrolase family 78 protein [Raineyella fluvialis]|uniref:alpha-L-rhamnosidase n=1 Tax=Raineyella fluvialis TaxID=2662261 RepID=A0A5Q2FD74_9ACTN|nr:glycoside hydrolase family 78 protein [Raineyella fluvialis]QGF23033.1 Bacterial alpha-L-rhamnosidase [Raineyella fluvialis]